MMTRFVLPDAKRRWDEHVSFRSLPLADCVLALWMIANGHESDRAAASKRLAALRDRLTVSQERAVKEQFGGQWAIGTLALAVIANLPNGDDTDAFLSSLHAVPEHRVVAHILHEAGEFAADAPRGPGVWRSLIADPAWASHYVRHFMHPAPADPEPLLAIIARPAAARDGLIELFRTLLPTAIAPLLPELSTIGTAAVTHLREEFRRSPDDFAVAFVPYDVWSGTTADALFWPSAFLGGGRIATTIDDPSLSLVAYGADGLTVISSPQRPDSAAPGEVVPEVAPPETYQDVYRLLGDPARWMLIQLLVAAPRYGQELAELLGLSIATVSHHLNGLKRLDLVDIRRDEHRLYYHLRTDRLRALLAGAEQGLLMR